MFTGLFPGYGQVPFLYLHDHLPRGDAVYSGLNPSTSIINQEYALTILPTGQSDGSIFSLEVPSSHMTLSLCPVDIQPGRTPDSVLKDLTSKLLWTEVSQAWYQIFQTVSCRDRAAVVCNVKWTLPSFKFPSYVMTTKLFHFLFIPNHFFIYLPFITHFW